MCEKLRCFVSTTSGRPWADSEGTPAPHFTFMLHFYPPHQAVGCSLKTKKKLLHSLEMDPVWFFSIRHVADFFYFWSAAVIYEPWIHLPPASQKKKKRLIPFALQGIDSTDVNETLKEGIRFSKSDHTSGVSETLSIPPNVTASPFICCTLSTVLYVFILLGFLSVMLPESYPVCTT